MKYKSALINGQIKIYRILHIQQEINFRNQFLYSNPPVFDWNMRVYK